MLLNETGSSMADVVQYIATMSSGRFVAYSESHDLDASGRVPGIVNWLLAQGGWFGGDSTVQASMALQASVLHSLVVLTSNSIPLIFMGQEFGSWQAFDFGTPTLDWSPAGVWKDDASGFGGIWLSRGTQWGLVQLHRELVLLRRNAAGVSSGLLRSLRGRSLTHVASVDEAAQVTVVFRCALSASDRERLRQQQNLQPAAGSTDSTAQQVTFLPPGSAFNYSAHVGCVVVVLNLGLRSWPAHAPLRVPLPALLPTTGVASPQWTVSVRTDSQQWFSNFTGVGAEHEVLLMKTDAQGLLYLNLAIGPWTGAVLTPVGPPPAGPTPGLSSVAKGLLVAGVVLAAAAAAWWGVRRRRTQQRCRFSMWQSTATQQAAGGLSSREAERAVLLADKRQSYEKVLSTE